MDSTHRRARRLGRPAVAVAHAVVATMVALAVLAVLAAPVGAAADGQDAVAYRPPVAAPIVNHFRPPEHPYGPGNRGVDYATAPGTDVVAAAPGRVTFAGAVGGRLIVVLLHADGLRSTYDGLGTISVAVGQWVQGGAVVGTATARLHFGIRDGATYLDPELLFATTAHGVAVGVVARLVPTDGSPARVAGARVARARTARSGPEQGTGGRVARGRGG